MLNLGRLLLLALIAGGLIADWGACAAAAGGDVSGTTAELEVC